MAGNRMVCERQRDRCCIFYFEPVAVCRQLAVQQVHRWRADKAGDKRCGRFGIDHSRCPDLFGAITIYDDHTVTQGHGLDLVMCHI